MSNRCALLQPHEYLTRNELVCSELAHISDTTAQAHILASQDPSTKSIADRLYGIVFLATPHRGADLAKVLGNILRASLLHSPKPFVSDLERNSAMISLINDEFRHHSTRLELFSFYETVESALGISSALIVNKDSAILGYPNEHNALLNATHRGICKFDTPFDPNYVSLRNVLAKITMKVTQRGIASKGAKIETRS